MRKQLVPALLMLLVITVITGIVYPLVTTAFAQVAFKAKADGSLVKVHGQVVGSTLIGQSFTKADGSTDPRYFQSRPSAAGSGYDGKASGASNYGPTNPTFLKLVAQRVAAYRKDNGLAPTVKVPVDAVTASGSGLDPHISPANAYLQAPRVAAARHLGLARVRALIAQHTDKRSLGVFGEPGVNVFGLNLALDRIAP